MAPLPTINLNELQKLVMELISSNRNQIPLSKTQLSAAITATDNWIDSNAASFNNALPVAARNGLTPKQKLFLFLYVATKRHEVG